MQISAVNDGGMGKKGKGKTTGDKRKGTRRRARTTRAVTAARKRNVTVGFAVNSKCNFKAIVDMA